MSNLVGPTISVVIPAYNAGATIKETLNSIVPQLGEGDEIVIVDDGSTDDTAEVIGTFTTKAVRYFYQDNSGLPSVPRNKGIARACGELILFFDSDDVMAPGKFEATRAAYRQFPDSGLICSNFRGIDDLGQEVRPSFLANYDFYRKHIQADTLGAYQFSPREARKALAHENFVGTSSVAVPHLVFETVGGFSEALDNSEDRELWLRITAQFPLTFINQRLHAYRLRTIGNITSRRISQRAAAKIEALSITYRATEDEELRMLLRTSISEIIYAQAYDHFLHGEMRAARSALLGHGPEFKHKKHKRLLLKTLLGRHVVYVARTLKRHFMHRKRQELPQP